MATVKEMQGRTNRIAESDFDNADLTVWFNDCQDDLSTVLRLPSRATIPNTDGIFLLPTTYKDDLKVLGYERGEYVVFGKAIEILKDAPAEIKIEFNKLPAKITGDPTQVPDIPVQFHYLYVLFAAMRGLMAEEEHERALLYKNDYLMAKFDLKKHMDKTKPLTRGAGGVWTVVR